MAIDYSLQGIIATTTRNNRIRFKLNQTIYDYRLPNEQVKIRALKFSPDGTHLLIISRTRNTSNELRISIIKQTQSRADHWDLIYDHLLDQRNISSFTFLNHARRSFVEPSTNNNEEEGEIEISSTRYRKLKKTQPIAINTYSAGKGETIILVLNTNEVLVIYLSNLNLPPHSILTTLDRPIEGLKLIPTPCPTHEIKEDVDNKKEVIHSAIGLPPCSVSINPSSEDEDHESIPHLLIATQTKLKPSQSPLPTIKQTIIKPILKSTSNQPCEDLDDDDQDLFITGISDLDQAFDMPKSQSILKPIDDNEDDDGLKQSSKPSIIHQNSDLVNHQYIKFEPSFDNQFNLQKINPGYGVINLIEILIDFETHVIPNLTINLLPNLSINDSFNYDTESQVTLNQLSFSIIPVNLTSSLLRLLASFTRDYQQEEEEEEEIQAWDIKFQSSKLSNGFLGLESLITPNLISSNDILRGPYEWVFNRISNRKLGNDEDPNMKIKIRKIIPEWKVKSGCILLFIEKIKKKKKKCRKDKYSNWIQNEDQSKREESFGYECWILHGLDLSTIDIINLDNLKSIEIVQICLSYHGVYCYSIDVNGIARASPLVSPNQSATIVGLIVNGIHNRESVEDISRLLSSSSSSCLTTTGTVGEEDQLEYMSIFKDVGTFIGLLSPSNQNFEYDPNLATSWNLGFDLWSSIPGYQRAADIALICRQLCVALGIVNMVKANHYSGSVWHMIGLSRWYSRLCQRIVGSIDPDSETPHLSLLPMSGCPFYCCFKIMVALTNFSNWLKAANPHQQPRPSQPTHAFSSLNPATDTFYQQQPGTSFAVRDDDQVEIAKTVFAEVWNHQNHIHMESWGKLLQDLGRTVYPKPGIGVTPLPPRQGQGFILPLSAVDPVQVRESLQDLRECIARHPMLIKPARPSTSSERPSSSSSPSADVQPPPSTLAPRTPPMGPSTTPTTSPPSVPPRTTGGEELVTNDKSTEEGTLFDKKTLATLKTINRTIKAVDDRAKYDVLVGINLSEILDSDKTNPTLDSHTSKRTLDGNNKINSVSSNHQLIKECVKCRARSLSRPWSNNDLYSSNPSFDLNNSAPLHSRNHSILNSYCNRLAQFDFSIREFKNRCICSGLWVRPSSSSSTSS
ncbi:hypothetical protein Pst134EA_017814 [Puccinia striiformis f. sp. tritici]|uniref:hypothetical protein n=1 Tax=Puccinia striiformis f. sp. tritici TaxID=168172 RepID=UPI0020083FF0|nr:hypothetical protein Pst134EA_017814 [Puccinia striiformis f. sp. tritici]KAH9461513.1 hypothetical protein Pst134EA_017814 [Puccinia striiformis f. sp. tritici]KAI9615877.1 hypothetical protein H4Q26_011128 [Puccinia striiformis f. sp. tritici PST-130]